VNQKAAVFSSNIWKLNSIRMLFWMHFFGPVLVPFFTQWGGLKLSQVFYLNAWFFFCNFLFEAPTGAVADFLGRKTSLALGALLGGTAAFLYTSRPLLAVFVAAEALFALAFTFQSGADEALAYDSLKAIGRQKDSKRILSRMESFKLGGILFASLTGGFIADRWGLTAPLRATGVAIFFSLFIVLWVREPGTGKGKSKKTSYGKILRDGIRFFMGHKILWLLTLEAAAVNALAWCIIWLNQPLLQQNGLALKYFGAVQALAITGQILLLSHVGFLERLFGSKRALLTAGGIVTGAAYLVLGWAHSLWIVIPAIVLAFTFGLTRLPLFSSYMNKYIPSDKRATVLSVSSMIRTFAIFLSMITVGSGLVFGSIQSMAIILGTCLVALSVFSRIEEGHLKD
jgi:MFS family permease